MYQLSLSLCQSSDPLYYMETTLTVNVYSSSLYLYAKILAHYHTHEMTLTVNVYTSAVYLYPKIWLTVTHLKLH